MGVQLQGRARDESVPNVTGVRVEFVQATGCELAGSEDTGVVIRGFHVLLLRNWFGSSPKKNRPVKGRSMNVGRTQACRDSPETRKPPSGGYLRMDPLCFLELSLLSSML